MLQAIGIQSEKVYAEGTQADIHRTLHAIFPSYKSQKVQGKEIDKETLIKPLYPEPIRIERLEE